MVFPAQCDQLYATGEYRQHACRNHNSKPGASTERRKPEREEARGRKLKRVLPKRVRVLPERVLPKMEMLGGDNDAEIDALG